MPRHIDLALQVKERDMAYNNYLLKINNAVFNNALLVVPSYQVVEAPIEILNYYDQTYGKHIEQAAVKETYISFTLRQLKSAEYAAALAKLNGTLQIEYFDAKTNGYKTGAFKMTSELNGSIWRILNNDVWMNSEYIKLEKVGQ